MRITRLLLGVTCLLLAAGCTPSRVATMNMVPVEEPGTSFTWTDTPEPVKKRERKLIVIDPGHGGDDLGTDSSAKAAQGIPEKSFNLTTALMLKKLLNQRGFDVQLTRSDDRFVSLKSRSQFANTQKPALFVSVHYNSAPTTKAEGVEVFFYNSEKDKARTDASKTLAELVLARVIEQTKAKSRGVKHGNLAVIRETNMPAILVEGGFLSNEKEAEKLKDPAYLQRVATGISLGIADYLK